MLQRWAEQNDQMPVYPAGEWGPPEADQLMTSTGRRWLAP
jgi:glucose-6-phosphate 1-dehydrogenase